MIFLPISILFFLTMIFLLPVIIFFIPMQVLAYGFEKLGLSPISGVMFFGLSLIGSTINIPIKEEEAYEIEKFPSLFSFLYGHIQPPIQKKVLAINLGGAVLPTLLAIYLFLFRAPIVPTLIATIVMIIITKKLARPVQNIGIVMPTFIPPILAAIIAWTISSKDPAPVAYISGVLGTLIGADLLNLNRIGQMSCGVMSIGGAGVFDGI
ncbi:MAG TPA: DUF1614 domain-containing protein, partial [bacterium (Candidatus Stahlbacteria)]|nr:DUF1614 domain-containing protein [Candidatus Stahlbacteria bacterium]